MSAADNAVISDDKGLENHGSQHLLQTRQLNKKCPLFQIIEFLCLIIHAFQTIKIFILFFTDKMLSKDDANLFNVFKKSSEENFQKYHICVYISRI